MAERRSNSALNSQPKMAMAAESLGKRAAVIENDDDDDNAVFGSTWVMVSARQSFFDNPFIHGLATPAKRIPKLRMWTDDYSNLFQILK